MHYDMIEIGGIIRAARIANDITQKALSESAGISIRTIIDIESNKRLPKLENLFSIIRILDIPADQLFRPDKVDYTQEQEQLMLALSSCSEREQKVFMQTAWAYIRVVRDNGNFEISE